MARRASVRYWPKRGSWVDAQGVSHKGAYCCWFKGRQYVLAAGPDDYPDGATYNTAVQKFAAMTTMARSHQVGEENPVRVVCDLYLRHCAVHRAPDTFTTIKKHLSRFLDALDPEGTLPVSALTPHMVNVWLDEMRAPRIHKHKRKTRIVRWSNGTVRVSIKTIKAALNWAVKSGLIPRNPLEHLTAPGSRSRGREALLGRTPAERAANHQRILAAAPKSFREFLIVLEATGCRPGELAKATSADFDREQGAIIYHTAASRLPGEGSHKTAREDKVRVIFLTGEALAIVTALADRFTRGPLFRSPRHKSRAQPKPWSDKSIEKTFWRIREKVGIPGLTAYSYRHTFATTWIEKGKSVDVLASLLGNSPEVIRRHYSHLLVDTFNLRRQIEEFRGTSDESTRSHTQAPSASNASPGQEQ